MGRSVALVVGGAPADEEITNSRNTRIRCHMVSYSVETRETVRMDTKQCPRRR
jgi:hypothetical protein